jgi:ubiquinone/menaquinone biosynthesis C-methylase UbiE
MNFLVKETAVKNHIKSGHFVVLFSLVIFFLGPVLQAQEHRHNQQRKEHLIRKDERERQRWHWQLPEQVMNAMDIKTGMFIGDIGAGDGYFTFRMAKRVGPEGKIYANEVDSGALQTLEERCTEKETDNVIVVRGEKKNPNFPDGRLDLILLVNVFHFLEDPVEYFVDLKKDLKPAGRLVIVQWDAEKMRPEAPGWDPEDAAKYEKKLVLEAARRAGYSLFKEEFFLPVQSLHIFISQK